MHPKSEFIAKDVITVRKDKFPDYDWAQLEKIVEKMTNGQEGISTYHSAWWTEKELEIVKKYVSSNHDEELKHGIKLANTLRQAAAVEELDYSPSMRETISYGKLLESGVSAKEAADIVFGNVYAQWGNVEYQKVSDIITSMYGS